jgi:hypothetical protein
METADYIDWDEGRDFDDDEAECEHLDLRVEEGEDVNEEDVTYFQAITCRDCGEELVENCIGELVARKRRAVMKTNEKGIPAVAFMAAFSSAGRDIAGPKVCVNCKANRARWDSIYCSEHCKWQFMDSLSEKAR